MKVERLVLGSFKVNCYIISYNKKNIIVDPGTEPETINKYLKENKVRPDFILNTHGHYDHIGAVSNLTSEYQIPFYIHEFEEPIIIDPAKNLSSFLSKNELSLKTYNLIRGTHIKNFGNLGIEIIITPGHTPGSIIIKFNNFLFSGDLLFKGGIGRTDLPGGDPGKIRQSLKILKEMDSDLIVYPGHGDKTTLGYELKTNYYLRNI